MTKKYIRYTIGDDFKEGDRMFDGTTADFEVWGVNAVYFDPIENREKAHINAIMICTSDEDRFIIMTALNKRHGLGVVGQKL